MKKKTPKFKDDPVVAEIRAIRAKMWKQAGGTVKGYMALIERLHAEQKARPLTAARPAQRRTKKPASRRRAA